MKKEIKYYGATYCAVCNGMKQPFMEKCRKLGFEVREINDLEDEPKGEPEKVARIYDTDTDKGADSALGCNIRSLPTIVYLMNDIEVNRESGTGADEYLEQFNEL